MSLFRHAIKTEAKLRLALAGPAGSGKTYTALLLARELAGDKPVAVIDTERGSASKYADLFAFDVCELDTFHPDRYVEAIRDAASAGYGVVVIDSLSHAWNGTDGLLELVEKIAKRDHKNTFQAWGDVKPIENRLVEAITGSAVHVIATMRSKTEYVVEQNDRGKATPRKVGTAPIQRDGFEYEFDVFGEMTPDNELIIQKTRCPALAGAVISKPGKPMAATLHSWLSGAPAPAAVRHEAPAQPHNEAPGDAVMQAEVTRLATLLKLSKDEKAALWKKHSKNLDAIHRELVERHTAMLTTTAEDNITFEVESDTAEHSLQGLPVHGA